MDKQARRELARALCQRYREGSSRLDKTKILDEFVAVTGFHRKHAIRVLCGRSRCESAGSPDVGRRVYDEAVKEALVVIWEASDRICGKRLKAIVPQLLDAMERHKHLALDTDVRRRLLAISPATIDRLLAPMRSKARGRKVRRAAPKVSKQVAIRTFSEWQEPRPGFLQVDFVAHCGSSMAGSFIHSLVATDVCSGWTESVPLLAREQSLVVEGIESLRQQFPIPILGINSDNDGAFINDTLLAYCNEQEIRFTRSRAYRKNDQAWVEQKNGSVVRRFVGHDRFTGMVAGQTLAHLYQATHLYVNYFQPSFKLQAKMRTGSKVKKSYFPPTTPCDRLLEQPSVAREVKKALESERAKLDPVELLRGIREAQKALAALASTDSASGPGRESLDQFLAKLPRLWQSGDARPTHRRLPSKPRHWRTRKDPFEAVWADVLHWLQEAPDATAKSLFERLALERPGEFHPGQLRTLQRRIRDWRHVMAKHLVFSCLEDSEPTGAEVLAIGVR